MIDNCQHVLLGCCTNLVDFYRRTGVEDKIRWFDELVFLEPGGRASFISASFLPAPMHTAPAFLRAACLGWRDKLAIARAMMILAGAVPDGKGEPFLVRSAGGSAPHETGEDFLAWLRRHHQTERAIDRFWKTILVSALNEDLDRVSVPYAAQVMRESFLKSPAAGRMGVPIVPLTGLYNAAGDYVRAQGGEIHLRNSIESFWPDPSRVRVRISDRESSREEAFDYLVLALPFDGLARVLPDLPESAPLRDQLSHFENSPITGIHLWLDRQISELAHAVLLDRTIQWMFHKSRLQPIRIKDNNGGQSGSYVELVVSSSKSLVEKSRAEIVDLALAELREFFPAARAANLVKSTVIKELHATYSPRPGIDAFRPASATAWPRVFLAGDFTAAGWPATMEGAVRSGYLASEALARAAGRKDASFLAPDLPPTGLMRLFA